MDKKTPETSEKLDDLHPATPKADDVNTTDAESVKGGRKAGSEQQEYMKITMSDIIVS